MFRISTDQDGRTPDRHFRSPIVCGAHVPIPYFREHRVIPLQYPTAQRTRNFLSCPTATASTKAPPSNGATPSPTVRAFHHVPQRPGLRVGFDTWTLFYISSPLCPMRCTIQMGWYAIKNQESTCFSWMDLDSDAKRDPSPNTKVSHVSLRSPLQVSQIVYVGQMLDFRRSRLQDGFTKTRPFMCKYDLHSPPKTFKTTKLYNRCLPTWIRLGRVQTTSSFLW